MNEGQLVQLRAVNTEINTQPFVLDSPMELPDTWKCVPDGKGWLCRDYVQCKAQRLREAGWPDDAGQLLTMLVYDELGEYHAVLRVADGADEWILDNRAEDIYRRTSEPYAYRWYAMQVAGTDEFEPLP